MKQALHRIALRSFETKVVRKKGRKQMRKVKNFIYITMLACLISIVLGCNSTSRNSALPFPKNPPETIYLYLSADTEGTLESCNCQGGQMGGLPRQAQFFLDFRQSPSLLLDAGNTMFPIANQQEYFKWYYILQIYTQMGYDALNLGQYEVSLTSTQISDMVVKLNIPLVSCNVLEKSSQKPLVKPYLIKNVDGVKIGIIGLVEPKEQPGEGIFIANPHDALSKYLPELVDKTHLIIVLSSLSLKSLNTIAQKFPQIDIILNTGGTSTFLPQKMESVVVSSLSGKGRYLQQLKFGFDSSKKLAWIEGANAPLDEKISKHEGTVFILEQYRNRLASQSLSLEGLENGID